MGLKTSKQDTATTTKTTKTIKSITDAPVATTTYRDDDIAQLALKVIASQQNHTSRRGQHRRKRKQVSGRIPRPMNCFMTYRLEKQKEIAQKCPGANHRDISKIIANWWRKEPEDIKKQYRDIAEVNKLEHSQKYPNYKYAPKKRDKKQESRKNSKPNNPLPVRVSRSMPVSLLPSPTAPFLPCPHLGMFPSAPQPPSFLFHPAPPSQWFDPFVGADSSLAQPLPCTSTSSLGSCEGQAPLLESSFSSSTIMSASTSNSDLDELMAHDFLAPSPSLYLPQEIMPAYSLQDYLVSDVPEEVPSSKIPIPD